ncbi:MAG: homoserine dehydrogenase [Dehalococcoidia bacterium]|jgi:homoserine dehydrogenase|nr:homoserine dehydrogenase [Dehalococcoidia bacterium]
MVKNEVGVGLLGLGTVGGGVTDVLLRKAEALSLQVGCPLTLKGVLVQDSGKNRSAKIDPGLMTIDPEDVLANPEVDVVVEVMGGEDAALTYIKGALSRGRHIVTANKEVMAKHGSELLNLAQANGVEIRYEAAVGGGIPLIAPFQHDLVVNDVSAIHSILNGTTNYILTRMAEDELDFSTALAEAQELGYAEPDPTFDIDGVDATYKLAILSSLAFHTWVDPQEVYSEGISRLTARDFRYARELGYAIKLLAIAKRSRDSIEARVHPAFIPEDAALTQVRGVYNAVQVEGDLVGTVMFYGRGAGAEPTSSAVVADLVAVGRNIATGTKPGNRLRFDRGLKVKPTSQVETRYYLRMNVADQAGVLAQISRILGDNLISISQMIQKEIDVVAENAELVIMTHVAREDAMQRALVGLKALNSVKEISSFVRVEM